MDGIFSGCSQLEEITFRGPLKNFTWYDASRPQLLRGFHPEKTFIGCNRLRRMTAWEILLTDFPVPDSALPSRDICTILTAAAITGRTYLNPMTFICVPSRHP